MPITSKQMDCVRQVSNFSVLKNQFRFDNKGFKSKDFMNSLEEQSPKLIELLENIKRIDAADEKEHGKTFKHFIFSDLDKGYGAKLIAAALIASDFKLVFTKTKATSLGFDEKVIKSKSNYKFAVLSSAPIYGIKIGPKAKGSILALYNSRPDNIYGNDCRFIVLDSGFKEGIDLFDVKYVHILEPQTSRANQKQVIGRATRTCGQKGLQFIPSRGWPLNVFIYDTELTKVNKEKFEVQTLHNLYLTGLDLRKLTLASELEKYSIVAAVDYKLNKNVHNFKIDAEEAPYLSFTSSFKGGNSKQSVDCKGNCGKQPTPSIPATVSDMILAWMSLGRIIAKSKKERLRHFLCSRMKKDPVYCQRVNEVYDNVKKFINDYQVVISFIYDTLQDDYKRLVAKPLKLHLKTKNVQPFVMRQELINASYMQYSWPKVTLSNLCETKPGTKSEFKFTPTQDFIRNYFTPSSPEKGLLLFQSVGTGKTCSAIATATTSFEPEDYTILWVTRTTLKSDIWKNMFDQICNVILQEKINDGLKLPNDLSDKKRLLSKSWKIPPLSYKQFTNLITKKNKKLYGELTDINGTKDPLRKTLLIIDEAHKLYGGDDLSAQERPNMPKLYEMLQNSYRISGEDSVKVLLMTATPYTNDPMEMVKLLNLIREKPLPESFEDFSSTYLDEKGGFTKQGKVAYMNDVAGYISFLNRELDARQFAQPNVLQVLVPMSERKLDVSSKKELSKKYKSLAVELDNTIEEHKTTKKHLSLELTDITSEMKGLNYSGCKTLGKDYVQECKNKVDAEKVALKQKKADIVVEKKKLDEQVKNTESKKKNLNAEKKAELKIFDTDFSQEKMLAERCNL